MNLTSQSSDTPCGLAGSFWQGEPRVRTQAPSIFGHHPLSTRPPSLLSPGRKGRRHTGLKFLHRRVSHQIYRACIGHMDLPNGKGVRESARPWTIEIKWPCHKVGLTLCLAGGKAEASEGEQGSFIPERVPTRLRENTASPCLGSDCFQLSISPLSQNLRASCDTFIWQQRGSRKCGKGVTPQTSEKLLSLWEWGGKIILLFGYVGRYSTYLKEMGIPDHLTCLLRNLYAGQEVTVRTRDGTTDWFQIGKGVHQGCTLPPCLFNLYAEYIMRNAGAG